MKEKKYYKQIGRSLVAIMAMMAVQTAQANDGVYFVSGNHLVPLQETNISIQKEVLTISLCDDGYASVDVQYEMLNNGPEKTITMGFEASTPYNDEAKINKNGVHPYIKDFSATMNGQTLPFRNGIAKVDEEGETDFTPLDMKKWREPRSTDPEGERGEALELYNPTTKEYTHFSYVYYFTAKFKQGVNTIHHTYRYQMSYGVSRAFEVPYWLTPAMRWANHKIDDFTLRVRADHATKHFLIDATCFDNKGFKVVDGKGKVRTLPKKEYRNELVEVVLRNGTIEWHGKNFTTTDDMSIRSADELFEPPLDTSMYYDSGPHYFPFFTFSESFLSNFGLNENDTIMIKRINRNLPYAHRGYVFKDAKLKEMFESQWWYMPEPQWVPKQEDFHPYEWKLINENK